MMKEKTKSFPVSKRMVYNSYLKVSSKDGAAGVDRERIKMFDANLSGNLYKIWNRMASGSYMPPPVRTVLIPKKQGGMRPLGIPTVGDRIAQGVVKDYLEPGLEQIFHNSSFGYRPGRSAHDALERCRLNCQQYAWVIDVDIKGFFDNISHDIMLKMLEHHTQEEWVLLYAERWLKAGVEQQDGSIAARTKGTPQGGVISPLLANLYLHHAFDQWMKVKHPQNPFERYADDIVIHCSSRETAEALLQALEARLAVFELSLHPEKTKIVFCKNHWRQESYPENSFDFLSYTFRPRSGMDKFGRKKLIVYYNGAISNKAKKSIRTAIRQVICPQKCQHSIEGFALALNPKIRGWINYYGRYFTGIVINMFSYVDWLLVRWIRCTYRIPSVRKSIEHLAAYRTANPDMFCHWVIGKKAKIG
jgi:RNA-directed DNA polymerase